MSAVLKVISAAPGVTVQDRGRPRFQRFGLTESGAMDQLALEASSALLGNARDAALIEMFQLGGEFEASGGAIRISLTGAPMRATINERGIAWNASHLLAQGDRLKIGACLQGLYGYLGVGGGIETPCLLGARATHTRAHIGGVEGRALAAGDILPIGTDEKADIGMALPPPYDFNTSSLRVLWGPSAHLFSDHERQLFLDSHFQIDPRMNRMGVRLLAEGAPLHTEAYLSGVSDAIAFGDIQIPGDGHPVILLADRQSTGGYPRIATVVTADLHKVVQIPPGRALRFEVVTKDEAVVALEKQAKYIKGLRDLVTPLVRDPSTIQDLLSFQLVSGFTAGEIPSWEETP